MAKNKVEGSTIQIRRSGGVANVDSVASQISSTQTSFTPDIQPGEVIDVIYDSSHPDFNSFDDIGKAKVRFLYDKKTTDESTLIWASPMNPNIIYYPLRGEIVYTVSFLGRLFYLNTLNYLNNINNNAVPNISLSRTKEQDENLNSIQSTGGGQIPNKSSTPTSLGETFTDQSSEIKPLQPFEGDVIVQGRFGNTIRLGNNPETNSPNIKITVGQFPEINNSDVNEPYVENINDNKNCVWITSDEIINFNPITEGRNYYLKSAKNKPTRYDGNQIFINSDRLVFNAKKEQILLFSNRGISLNTSGYVAIDSSDDVGITTLNKLNIEARSGTYIDSREILLGKNATEPLILGNKFLQLMNELLTELINETHPTGTGPSGPPVNAAKYRVIQNKLRTLLSKQNKTL